MYVPEWNKLALKVWVGKTHKLLDDLDWEIYSKFPSNVPVKIQKKRDELCNIKELPLDRKAWYAHCCQIAELCGEVKNFPQ